MPVEITTIAFVFPDTLVDRFVAKIEGHLNFQRLCDLLRTPLFFQPGLDEPAELSGCKVTVSS